MIMISDGEQTAGADGLLRNKIPDFMQKSKVINGLGKKNKCFEIKGRSMVFYFHMNVSDVDRIFS